MAKARRFQSIRWITGGVLAYLALLLILYFSERGHPEGNINSFADAVWYSIVTLSTVGYGDYYPTTLWGKIAGFVFIFASVSLFGLLVGWVTVQINRLIEMRKLGFMGTKFQEHTIIIGYNNGGLTDRRLADLGPRRGGV